MIRVALFVFFALTLFGSPRVFAQCSNGSFGVHVTFTNGSGSYCVDTNILGAYDYDLDIVFSSSTVNPTATIRIPSTERPREITVRSQGVGQNARVRIFGSSGTEPAPSILNIYRTSNSTGSVIINQMQVLGDVRSPARLTKS